MSSTLSTGFDEIDKLISEDKIVEFYSTDSDILYDIYHRVIAFSSPINVVITGERGGIDPLILKKFERILGRKVDVMIRRAFKAEDVSPSIKSFDPNEDLIIIDPYHYLGKYIEYTKIVSAIRFRNARTLIFSFMDREKSGSIFGLHTAHAVIEVKKGIKGFQFRLKKSVSVGYIEIPYSFYDLFIKPNKNSSLITWLV